MRSDAIVIVGVGFQNPTQMHLAQDNDVVQTLTPDRADQPFGKAILPGRGWCGGLLFITLLIMCAGAASAASNVQTCWYNDGGCRAFIGKRLWVSIPSGNPNVVEVTFTQHDWTTERTLKLKSGSSFVVKDIAKGKVGSDDYFIVLDDGRRGWTETSSPFLIDYDPVARSKQAAEECARRGQPKIGMTPTELVETCWGKPLRIIKKTTVSGIEESFVYGIGHKVKVIDGKVAEIVESR